ncbi:MAG: hypothetical protein AB1896_21240 [Thermodesulfobacteriota bacterium]
MDRKSTERLICLLSLAVLAMVLLHLPGCAAVPAGPPAGYLEPRTGLVFPDWLGTTSRLKVQEFDDPRLGVTIFYQGHDPYAAINLYIYNMGYQTIPWGVSSPVIKDEFIRAAGEIAALEKMGRYQEVTREYDMEITIRTRGGPLPALLARYGFVTKETPTVSFLVLTGYRNNFLKIRYSFPSQDEKRGLDQFQDFLSALGHILE